MALLATATVVQGQLGNRSAEDWIRVLERERRVQGLKVEEVVARLDLNSGDVVVDIGAGSGAFFRTTGGGGGAGRNTPGRGH